MLGWMCNKEREKKKPYQKEEKWGEFWVTEYCTSSKRTQPKHVCHFGTFPERLFLREGEREPIWWHVWKLSILFAAERMRFSHSIQTLGSISLSHPPSFLTLKLSPLLFWTFAIATHFIEYRKQAGRQHFFTFSLLHHYKNCYFSNSRSLFPHLNHEAFVSCLNTLRFFCLFAFSRNIQIFHKTPPLNYNK